MGLHEQQSESEVKSTHPISLPDQLEVESISAPLPATDGIHLVPSPAYRDSSTLEKQAPDSIASGDVDPILVPKSQRRGLLAHLAVIAEVDNPKHYTRRTKWLITFVVAVAAAAAPIGSSIILPGLSRIAREFNSPSTVTNLAVALYMLSMSIFPLWWSSFSETLGRRTIYLVSFFLFIIFNVLSAVSVNIAMFIVMRVLSGGAAASVQAVGAGTIADIWHVKERGNAMSMFYLGPLCGPLLAPIIGGALTQGFGWRSCMWWTTVYGVLLWFSILFFLPETLKYTTPPVTPASSERDTDTRRPCQPGTS